MDELRYWMILLNTPVMAGILWQVNFNTLMISYFSLMGEQFYIYVCFGMDEEGV